RRQPIDLIIGPTVFDGYVLALNTAGFLQPLAESAQQTVHPVKRSGVEESDHRQRRLLRPCRERPRRRAAQQRDELATFHSITSPARASSVGGTSRPSALAVLRLMTRSNLVGCWTGRSAGFSPLRMRST